MDKQKEIEKMACDMCLWRQGCNSPNEPIDTCKPLHMAKKAVEAGYGDVRAAVKETAQEIFAWFWRNLVNLNFITGNIEVNFGALQNFAKTYGIELFGNTEQVEEELKKNE